MTLFTKKAFFEQYTPSLKVLLSRHATLFQKWFNVAIRWRRQQLFLKLPQRLHSTLISLCYIVLKPCSCAYGSMLPTERVLEFSLFIGVNLHCCINVLTTFMCLLGWCLVSSFWNLNTYLTLISHRVKTTFICLLGWWEFWNFKH